MRLLLRGLLLYCAMISGSRCYGSGVFGVHGMPVVKGLPGHVFLLWSLVTTLKSLGSFCACWR